MKNASMPNQMDRDANAHHAKRIAPPNPMMLATFKLRIGPILSQSSPRTNLSAIKRVNRNQIKKQQHAVYKEDRHNEIVEIWMNSSPVEPSHSDGE